MMKRLFILFVFVAFAACRHSPKQLSFYYWRTQFHLDSLEKKVLREQQVKQLYVRYFDIDFKPEDSQPAPVSPIQLNKDLQGFAVVPVIFIKNRTFEKLDSSAVPQLAQHAYQLTTQINNSASLQPAEMQFDCDWTDRTKNKYFQFIRAYRELSKQRLSATIRLHQVKYRERTGVPPVDQGVLMYYNMGEIGPGKQNSIYEKDVAARYNAAITSYPLPLTIALPIFSWGYTIRDGRVVQLLNKINFTYFANDSNFIPAGENRLLVKQACFKAGYYFQQQDIIKLEHVPEADLVHIAKDINRYAGQPIQQVILYDLDSANIVLYDEKIFEKILDHLD